MNELTDSDFSQARLIQDRFRSLESAGVVFEATRNRRKERFMRIFKKKKVVHRAHNHAIQVSKISATVVIPVFGPSPSLAECVERLVKSQHVNLQVILIDNEADPVQLEKARRQDPEIIMIRNKTNLGFGQGCHQGITASDNDIVVLLNSDAFVEPDTVSILCNNIVNHPNLGVCGALCLNRDFTIQEVGRVLNSNAHSFPIAQGRKSEEVGLCPLEYVPYVSFVCVAIKKSLYQQIDGFDPELSPAYSEDVDLCLRLASHDYRIAVATDAKVIHSHGESGDHLEGIVDIKERNRAFVLEKHKQYFTTLPTLQQPDIYPHEIFISRTTHIENRVLFLISHQSDVDEVVEMNNNCRDTSKYFGIIDEGGCFEKYCAANENLAHAYCDVYTDQEKIHHWLRDRIGVFNRIVIGKNFSSHRYDYIMSLIVSTQPFAQFSLQLDGLSEN